MEFTPLVVVVLILAFWWSGFVRAGLGFGGAGLMYPVALLVIDQVVFLVPIICVQLMLFSGVTLIRDHPRINWRLLGLLFLVLIPPFMVGVFDLISLADEVMLGIVYAVVISYSLGYIFNLNLGRAAKWLDFPVLLVGGYVSGLSLAGAPLIAAVAIRHLPRHQMRASLFVLWWVLCAVKLSTLYAYDVDLQLRHQLWLLPSALIGHLMGMKLHDKLLQMQTPNFFRWMGLALLCLSLAGILRQWL